MRFWRHDDTRVGRFQSRATSLSKLSILSSLFLYIHYIGDEFYTFESADFALEPSKVAVITHIYIHVYCWSHMLRLIRDVARLTQRSPTHGKRNK